MQYYLAPMEGITTYIYRNAYAKYFGGIDKYFTPFISDKNFITDKSFFCDKNFICDKNSITDKNMSKSLTARELRDILPENNVNIPLVPQVLTNHAGRFLAVAKEIAAYGYDTVNLNLGCPSGTVTAKKRGAGFLSVPDELDAFLYEIFARCPLQISVKTRLGVSDLSEWDRLLEIYAKYPIHELIIHTRLQQEFYTGKTHPEAYTRAIERLQADGTARNHHIPLCYNGDIVSAGSLKDVLTAIDTSAVSTSISGNGTAEGIDADRIMIGRGIIQNPALAGQLQSVSPGSPVPKETWHAFHNEILDGYTKIMSGDSPVLFKMKDLWTYMSRSFTSPEKYLKKIRKANRIADYVCAVDALFREQDIAG